MQAQDGLEFQERSMKHQRRLIIAVLLVALPLGAIAALLAVGLK